MCKLIWTTVVNNRCWRYCLIRWPDADAVCFKHSFGDNTVRVNSERASKRARNYKALLHLASERSCKVSASAAASFSLLLEKQSNKLVGASWNPGQKFPVRPPMLKSASAFLLTLLRSLPHPIFRHFSSFPSIPANRETNWPMEGHRSLRMETCKRVSRPMHLACRYQTGLTDRRQFTTSVWASFLNTKKTTSQSIYWLPVSLADELSGRGKNKKIDDGGEWRSPAARGWRRTIGVAALYGRGKLGEPAWLLACKKVFRVVARSQNWYFFVSSLVCSKIRLL